MSKLPFVLPESCQGGECGHSFNLHLRLFGCTREEARALYEKAKSGPPVVIPASDPYQPMFGNPVAPWHRYFAWKPVETVDRGYRWLCVVWRRRVAKKAFLDGGADFWRQYAVDIQQGRY